MRCQYYCFFTGFKRKLTDLGKSMNLDTCQKIADIFNNVRKPLPGSWVSHREVIVLGMITSILQSTIAFNSQIP